MSDLPNELIIRPTALIGLIGLDISNSIHNSVWDAFNNRRSDGAAIYIIKYKLFNESHEFPTVKPKVNIFYICDWDWLSK